MSGAAVCGLRRADFFPVLIYLREIFRSAAAAHPLLFSCGLAELRRAACGCEKFNAAKLVAEKAPLLASCGPAELVGTAGGYYKSSIIRL